MDDWELLRAYVQNGSEESFQQLVERHVDHIYSMALRQTGDAYLAQDVTQAVFIILVRKAGSLSRSTVLAGWFFKTTQYVARTALRAERRRQQREMTALEAAMMETDAVAVWDHVRPHLDDALASLSEADRNAVLLRFFHKQSVRDVAKNLGVTEAAAQKRIVRAVEKLRAFFASRGFAVSAVALLAAVSTQAVQPAPSVVTQVIISAVFNTGGVSSTPVAALVQGALRKMSLSKLVVPVGISACALLTIMPFVVFGPEVRIADVACITNQPLSQTTTVGDAVTLSVGVTGGGPWSYQWYFNRKPITGAVQRVLTLRNVQMTHAGDYSVLVAHPAGSITSAAAALTVNVVHQLPTISGLLVMSTDPAGGYREGNRWNTRARDRIVNIYAIAGSNTFGPFVNGPSDEEAGISLPLTPGTHTVTMFAAGGEFYPRHGLNIFFNDDNSTPAISVFAPTQISPGPPFPIVAVNSSPSSQALDGRTVPAANSLRYSAGENLITLTDFRWAVGSVHNLDRVGFVPFGHAFVGQDGSFDWIGQFTVNVVSASAINRGDTAQKQPTTD
jgi:RNA polymerase sigma factor (sigma-70 family)